MHRLERAQNLLGPTTHNRHMVQAQQLHHFLEEIRAPEQGLQQGDLEVGANQRQRDAGKAGCPNPHRRP